MHLDTHAVLWLYDSGPKPFPAVARQRLAREPLSISPMVELELGLLHEIGRMAPEPSTVLTTLARTVGLTVSTAPFADVVGAATTLTWTRDPFDRLICAHAVAEQQALLTKDRRIRAHFSLATWD